MTKRIWTLPLLAVVLIALGSGSSFAIPSLGGPTGVVATPTAMVAPVGDLQAAISYQSLQDGGILGSDSSADLTVWGLQALAGVSDKAELWAAYGRLSDGNDTHMWGIGGKLQLTKEPQDDATLAIGASYGILQDIVVSSAMYDPDLQEWVGEDLATDITAKTVYLVATKDLTPVGGQGWEWGPGGGTKMLGSLGLMYISLDPDLAGIESESLTRPFVNMEFIGAGGTTLGLEYRWKDDTMDMKAVFSAVLRHPFSDQVTAEIGTTNSSPGGLGMDGQDWFVRLGMNLPLGGGG